ncbi:MAG: molecular chaperone HtpG [Candidatus Cloacimonadota bacterium]|nr:molecular chaperone HtpG [Candidatus Cloacimonadota bacterium]
MTQDKKGKLSIHTENIFPIIKKWLYSEHDIFLRELISNAVDAMQKRRAADPNVDPEELKIELKLKKGKKTLEVIDYGIGMTATEIKKYINQIAFSGAEDFIKKYKDKQSNIIGHFGLGFYSSFMVAKKVTIDSLSYKKNSKPAYWECEGQTEYILKEGKRKKPGTTVTVYFNDDNKEYLEEEKLKELVQKYSNFVPFPIKMGKDILNLQEALWNKKPNKVEDKEYKEFYKKLFNDYRDPLFWIHLNVDFPFNFKGILYFPPLKNQIDVNQGEVKLFCNNVFVADNLKQIIPDFLLLLKGGIDIPDIPLNVSRSFLQEDATVRKISQYIIKKIGDSLKDIFKNERKRYEGFWDEIQNFIKYGILTNEKFSESMHEYLIFKTTQGDYVTIQEYLDRNKSDEKPRKVYYAASEDTQISYINMMKEQSIEVIYSDSMMDNHIFQHLEMKLKDISFVRVDSEINEKLVDADKKEVVDAENKTQSEKLKEIFDKMLNNNIEAAFNKDSYADFIKKHPEAVNTLAPYIRTEKDFTYIKPYDIPPTVRKKLGKEAFQDIMDKVNLTITTQVKHLKSKDIPAMLVFNEFMRRFQEMNSLYRQEQADMLQNHTIIVNTANETVKKIVKLYDDGQIEKVKTLVNYIHDLAMLEQKQFSGKELQNFITKANEVLQMI